ncbi:MAG TPA: hypothetical protein PLM00_00730 [Spirochaetota bacterium]|nr:hypothetical protein [Spirochaetota bacterium]
MSKSTILENLRFVQDCVFGEQPQARSLRLFRHDGTRAISVMLVVLFVCTTPPILLQKIFSLNDKTIILRYIPGIG